MPGEEEQAADVLAFWFVQSRPRQWFAKDPAFDALLQQRFQGLTRRAIAGELAARSAWVQEMSMKHGPHCYLDPQLFRPDFNHGEQLEQHGSDRRWWQ
ncbi:MAG: DUF924 family protein, partial [Synechococcaceae cyanobacterium]